MSMKMSIYIAHRRKKNNASNALMFRVGRLVRIKEVV